MRVHYDREVDVLDIRTGEHYADTFTLRNDDNVAVDIADNGRDVVGFLVIGASRFLPLQRGYDAKSDVLTIGETTDDPAMLAESGDFVGYWQPDEYCPDEFLEPIGVAVRQASKHLAPILAAGESATPDSAPPQ